MIYCMSRLAFPVMFSNTLVIWRLCAFLTVNVLGSPSQLAGCSTMQKFDIIFLQFLSYLLGYNYKFSVRMFTNEFSREYMQKQKCIYNRLCSSPCIPGHKHSRFSRLHLAAFKILAVTIILHFLSCWVIAVNLVSKYLQMNSLVNKCKIKSVFIIDNAQW